MGLPAADRVLDQYVVGLAGGIDSPIRMSPRRKRRVTLERFGDQVGREAFTGASGVEPESREERLMVPRSSSTLKPRQSCDARACARLRAGATLSDSSTGTPERPALDST